MARIVRNAATVAAAVDARVGLGTAAPPLGRGVVAEAGVLPPLALPEAPPKEPKGAPKVGKVGKRSGAHATGGGGGSASSEQPHATLPPPTSPPARTVVLLGGGSGSSGGSAAAAATREVEAVDAKATRCRSGTAKNDSDSSRVSSGSCSSGVEEEEEEEEVEEDEERECC